MPGLLAVHLSALCVAASLAGRPAVSPVVRDELPVPAAAVARLERSLRDMRELRSDRFVLVTDVSEGDAQRVLSTLERTADAVERFATDMDVAPRELRERIVAVGFADRVRFERFARVVDSIDASWMSGYWLPGADRVAFRLGTPEDRPAHRRRGVLASASAANDATVAHELAHQLLHRLGVQRRSGNAPLWLSEGLAIAFETCGVDGGTAFDAQPERSERVRAQLDAGTSYAMSSFVATARLPARTSERVDAFYDQAWSLARYLVRERHDAMAAYLAGVRDGAGNLGPRVNLDLFERTFGPIDEVERAWRESVASTEAVEPPTVTRSRSP
ncbi:MAG: DUF1570 domain-containing protein [Phycisphaerales bacterium]